jgi:hypothetical protein
MQDLRPRLRYPITECAVYEWFAHSRDFADTLSTAMRYLNTEVAATALAHIPIADAAQMPIVLIKPLAAKPMLVKQTAEAADESEAG